MTLLSLENASVTLGNAAVLEGINFNVVAGEIVTIVGPNGSGKSTLLRALIGAVPLKVGRLIRGADVKVGYVPQKMAVGAQMPMTVDRFMRLPSGAAQDDINNALDLSGAGALKQRMMNELSGGQFQRVLLARAILNRPDVLLLDEATQGLDQPGSAAFYKNIEGLRRDMGCAVVLVSHELHVVMAASDRVICLNGHVCCEGHPETVASAPEYRALFGTGTGGALALYRHEHMHHHHDHDHGHTHSHPEDKGGA